VRHSAPRLHSSFDAMTEPRTNPVEDLLRDAAWMRALARRVVSDREHVDDAIQDAWVVALEKHDEPRAGSRPWIAGVFKNLARQEWRSARARQRRERTAARPEALPSTIDVVARAQAQGRLVEAVLALDEPYRSTILLHYFDGLTAEEIARREEVPGSTVRSRLGRGIAELRRRLERKGGANWAVFLAPLADPGVPDGSAVATAATGTSSAVLGGLAMSMGAKFGVGIVVVLALAWWVWPGADPSGAAAIDAPLRAPARLELAEEQTGEDADRTAIVALAEERLAAGTAESSSPAPGLASIRVHVTWAEDGTSAPGAPVRIYAWGAPDPFVYSETRTTDADGVLLFDAVHPGEVSLLCQLGGEAKATVAAGERAETAIAIPVGIAVEGEVVDADGRAVADAAIWLSDYGNGSKGEEVARAGSDGRFRLRSIGEGRRVAARAPEFAPSPSYDVGGKPGDTLRPRIVMSARGGQLRGVVRDSRGTPVAGALVQVGREGTSTFQDSEGRYLSTPPPLRIRTDRDGGFRLEGEAVGRVPLAVRARGLAPWSGFGEIEVGRTSNVDVELTPGAVVRGCVRDGEGRPLAGLYVGHGQYGSVAGTQTRTAADGSFALEGLPSGEVELGVNGRDLGKVRTKLTLTPGGEFTWDPVLAQGPSISGRVLDDEGRPLANWLVAGVDDESIGRQLLSKRTDEHGAFVLQNWPKEAVRIEVHDPEAWTHDAVVTLRDPEIGQQDLVIRVPSDSRATSSIEGRVVDENGDAIAGATVTVWRADADSGMVEQADPRNGAFRIAPIRPGSYRLSFEAPGRGRLQAPAESIAPNQRRDMGSIVLAPAGFVRVELVPPAGSTVSRWPEVSILGADGRTAATIAVTDGQGRSELLAPGTYLLRIRTHELRAEDESVTVASGADTAVRIRLEPATARTLDVDVPTDFDRRQRVRVVVRDALGRTVVDHAFKQRVGAPLLVHVPGLKVGTYSVEASTESGLSGSVTFDVADLSPHSAGVTVRLR